jgi:uncharacterized protein (DUF2249 family)/hemerythrin-like domain-containing protein
MEGFMQVDLRSFSTAERTAKILASFDALAPGETVVLVTPDSAGDPLRRLQTERRGLFDWSVIRPGPGIWKIEVSRRAATAGPLRGVNESFSWDHDRLDALEAAAFEKRCAGDLEAARDLYSAFAAGLRRHIGVEEQILFPAFEERAGMPPTEGPTAVMRAEHREIEDLLAKIEGAIGEAGPSVETLRRSLHMVLEDHNLKEEQVLYPVTDDLLGGEEADRLVGRVQRYGS